jgi:hypothetical protein
VKGRLQTGYVAYPFQRCAVLNFYSAIAGFIDTQILSSAIETLLCSMAQRPELCGLKDRL